MESDAAALRPWVLRCAAPLVIFAANALGFAFTNGRVAKGALGVAYTTVITATLLYGRIVMADERRRTVLLPASAVGPAAVLSVREYDMRALKELCSSVGVGLAVAWMLHARGVTSSVLVLQTRAYPAHHAAALGSLSLLIDETHSRFCWRAVVLPLTVADHELVRLHVRGASESQPGLRRPWRTEPEKMQAACVWPHGALRLRLHPLTACHGAGLASCAACSSQRKGREAAI